MISTRKKSEVTDTGLKLDVKLSPLGGIDIKVASMSDEAIIYGDQLLDKAAAEPTIDRYLDRSPKLNTIQDYEEMVTILQRKRAAFITAEQKRKEPKVEGEENVEIQEG